MIASELRPGVRVRHYKGGLYVILHLAANADTLQPQVVYRSEADGCVWVRSRADFCGHTAGGPRFEVVEEASHDG